MEEKHNKTTAIAQHDFPAAAVADAGVGRWLSHTIESLKGDLGEWGVDKGLQF